MVVRFDLPGGENSLALRRGHGHCGTDAAGWLSGWRGGGAAAATAAAATRAPPPDYATPGALPTPRDGVVPATACFNGGDGDTCGDHAPIAVLHCGAFLLWRLPDAPGCPLGYCAAPSGLFGE